MLKYKNYKKIVFLICCILSFCIACSNTNKSPEVTTSLTTSNGTEIEPIEVEDWMKERAITVSNLLEEQDYIKAATVSFLYSPNDKKKFVFMLLWMENRLVNILMKLYPLLHRI